MLLLLLNFSCISNLNEIIKHIKLYFINFNKNIKYIIFSLTTVLFTV